MKVTDDIIKVKDFKATEKLEETNNHMHFNINTLLYTFVITQTKFANKLRE